MANYCWDFGFDWNAVQDAATGNYFLQSGFVNLAGGAVPGTPVNLQNGDQVKFFLYNLTSGATASDNYTLTSGSVTFGPADQNQSSSSPFSGAVTIAAQGNAPATNSSTIFSGDTNPSVKFPMWALAGPFTVVEPATIPAGFLMTATITIQYSGSSGTTSQTYVVDPEMVVGGAG